MPAWLPQLRLQPKRQKMARGSAISFDMTPYGDFPGRNGNSGWLVSAVAIAEHPFEAKR
jgi:hypothetical protein